MAMSPRKQNLGRTQAPQQSHPSPWANLWRHDNLILTRSLSENFHAGYF